MAKKPKADDDTPTEPIAQPESDQSRHSEAWQKLKKEKPYLPDDEITRLVSDK